MFDTHKKILLTFIQIITQRYHLLSFSSQRNCSVLKDLEATMSFNQKKMTSGMLEQILHLIFFKVIPVVATLEEEILWLYSVSFSLTCYTSHLLSTQSFHLHSSFFLPVNLISPLFRSQNHDDQTLHKTCLNHYGTYTSQRLTIILSVSPTNHIDSFFNLLHIFSKILFFFLSVLFFTSSNNGY